MRNYGLFFRTLRFFVRIFKPPFQMNVSEEIVGPIVFVGRHHNLKGPFTLLLSTDRLIRVWMLDVLMDWRTCYKQYVDYTFTKRFGMPKVIASVIAFLPAIFIAQLMKSAKGIPVYRHSRSVLKTLNESVDSLLANESIAIFPDIDYASTSEQMSQIYEGFLNIEKYYYKRTGKHVVFAPLIMNENKKEMSEGQHVSFEGNLPFNEERKIIAKHLYDALNGEG